MSQREDLLQELVAEFKDLLPLIGWKNGSICTPVQPVQPLICPAGTPLQMLEWRLGTINNKRSIQLDNNRMYEDPDVFLQKSIQELKGELVGARFQKDQEKQYIMKVEEEEKEKKLAIKRNLDAIVESLNEEARSNIVLEKYFLHTDGRMYKSPRRHATFSQGFILKVKNTIKQHYTFYFTFPNKYFLYVMEKLYQCNRDIFKERREELQQIEVQKEVRRRLREQEFENLVLEEMYKKSLS